MKKIILLFLVPFIFSSCKKEDKDDPIETAECIRTKNMFKYHNDTNEMTRDGMYKTALKRTVWFHENALKYAPAMSGVRLSFALSDWKKLADNYPPAMKALKEIRDRDTKKVLQTGDDLVFHDVSSINHYLEDDSKSFDLFVTLSHRYPSMINKYLCDIEDDLFDAKRYDIIKTYIGNPMDHYHNLKKDLEGEIRWSEGDENLNDRCKEDFALRCTQLIEYCVAVNDLASAKEIEKKALTVLDVNDLNNAIPVLTRLVKMFD